MPLGIQLVWLFVLALPIACVSWTLTHEDIFREVREVCVTRSQTCKSLFARKFLAIAIDEKIQNGEPSA